MSIKLFSLINEQSWYFYLALILFTVISFSAESCANSTGQGQSKQNIKSSSVATAVDNINVLIKYLN